MEGLNTKFYKERAETLKPLKSLKAVNESAGIVKINAASNIANLASEIFTEIPSCTTETKCTICKTEKTDSKSVISINYQTLKAKGFSHLVRAMEDGFHTAKCCGKLPLVNREYGAHVIIDTDPLIPSKTKLSEIPYQFNPNENQAYSLAGAITYSGRLKKMTSGTTQYL